MGGFKFIQKILDNLQKFIDGFAYRREKKYGAVHGDEISVRAARRKISYAILGAAVLLLVALTIREGLFLGSDFFIDREIPSAPRQKIEINDKISPNDFDLLAKATAVSSGTDCRRLSIKLKDTGALDSAEKAEFLKDCVAGLSGGTSAVITKVLSENLEPEVTQRLLNNLNEANVAQIKTAIENPEVLENMKGDAGAAVADAVANITGLKPEELAQAAAIIATTPPQYRAASTSAIRDIAQISNPSARKNMLEVLNSARTPDDISLVKNFSRELKSMTPDEQKILSETFTKAATPEARRSLTSAVSQIARIPQDDPVRGRLVEAIAATNNLPTERQAKQIGSISDAASRYTAAETPDKKQAIADGINTAGSADDFQSLSNRLATLDTLKNIQIPERDVSDYIQGKNPTVVEKLTTAAEAVKSGSSEDAKKIISGYILAEDTKYKTATPSASINPSSETAPALLKQQLDEAEKDLSQTRSDMKKLEAEVITLKALDLPPTDTKVVQVYANLATKRSDEKLKVESVERARENLRAKIEEIKGKAAKDFTAMGVVMPDIKIPVGSDKIMADQPNERLTDLRSTPGFFDKGKEKKKSKKLHFGEISSAGTPPSGSLLADSVAKMPKSWIVSGAPGASGQADRGISFEMSRTQFAPGIMLRIPPKGIPSDKAAKYNLFFKFLGSVADRRTGSITVPSGSLALCKVQEFDKNTGKLSAKCDRIDVGGSADIETDLMLCDADGSDGLTGAITDNRGWYLAGVFVTAFTAAVLDGYSQSLIAPYEAKTQQTLGDYTARGSISGAALIARDIADKQIEEWQKAPYFWQSFDGALASVRQN